MDAEKGFTIAKLEEKCWLQGVADGTDWGKSTIFKLKRKLAASASNRRCNGSWCGPLMILSWMNRWRI